MTCKKQTSTQFVDSIIESIKKRSHTKTIYLSIDYRQEIIEWEVLDLDLVDFFHMTKVFSTDNSSTKEARVIQKLIIDIEQNPDQERILLQYIYRFSTGFLTLQSWDKTELETVLEDAKLAELKIASSMLQIPSANQEDNSELN